MQTANTVNWPHGENWCGSCGPTVAEMAWPAEVGSHRTISCHQLSCPAVCSPGSGSRTAGRSPVDRTRVGWLLREGPCSGQPASSGPAEGRTFAGTGAGLAASGCSWLLLVVAGAVVHSTTVVAAAVVILAATLILVVAALGSLKAMPRITEAFRSGAGLGWHEQDEDVFTGCELFFRPGYIANLVPSWIPALDGVVDKPRSGTEVADIGCGLGASTILLAQEYPQSRFTGSDYHDQSIEMARKRAGEAGVADRVSFEVASAVEPYATDDTAGNMNPMGRVSYSFSTLLCVPNTLSQSGGYALGAQAGDAAIRQVVTDAGFTGSRARPRRRSIWCMRSVPSPPLISVTPSTLISATGNALTAKAGTSLGEVMNRMGHSSTRAARIYLHASANADGGSPWIGRLSCGDRVGAGNGNRTALSAWKSVPSGPVTWPDLRGRLSASDRERPLATRINGR